MAQQPDGDRPTAQPDRLEAAVRGGMVHPVSSVSRPVNLAIPPLQGNGRLPRSAARRGPFPARRGAWGYVGLPALTPKSQTLQRRRHARTSAAGPYCPWHHVGGGRAGRARHTVARTTGVDGCPAWPISHIYTHPRSNRVAKTDRRECKNRIELVVTDRACVLLRFRRSPVRIW